MNIYERRKGRAFDLSGRKRRGITGEIVGFDGKKKTKKKNDTLKKAEEKESRSSRRRKNAKRK